MTVRPRSTPTPTPTPLALAIAALLLSTGCGDDADAPPDAARDAPGPSGDAAADAPPAAACTCVALGGDLTSGVGVVSSLALPSLEVATDLVPLGSSSDTVVRVAGGLLYLVNRAPVHNVTIVDPTTWTVRAQFSTGEGSNPYDIAVSADGRTGWVALFGRPEVQVWDLVSPGEEPARRISLAALDADGNPDAASIALAGGRLLAPLSRLDPFWTAADPGQVAVIDPVTEAVLGTFDLTHANPFGFVRARPGGDELLVATVGAFDGASGCVERITTGVDPAAAGCLVENTVLGGYVSGIAPAAGGDVYLAVAWMEDGAPKGKIVRAPPSGGGAPASLTPAGQVVTDVALCDATDQLVYTDSAVGGLRVLAAASGTEVTTQALDVGLPPIFAGGLACW